MLAVFDPRKQFGGYHWHFPDTFSPPAHADPYRKLGDPSPLAGPEVSERIYLV